MDTLFNCDDLNIRKHGGRVHGMITDAAGCSDLADKEPRIHKTPFKSTLFGDVIKSCLELRCSLCCLEETASATGKDDSPKADVIVALYKLPSFQVVKKDFDNYILDVEKIYDIFLHETDQYYAEKAAVKSAGGGKSPLDKAKDNIQELVKDLDAFVKTNVTAKKSDVKHGSTSFASLEDDSRCKISMIIFVLNWQFAVLYELKHRMLSD